MNTQQKTFTAFIESACNKFNCPEMATALKEGFQAFCEASETISDTLKGAATEKVNCLASRIISEYQPGDDLCKVGRYITDVLRQKISKNKYAGIFPFEGYVLQLIGFDENILQHFIDMMNECGIRSSILHETMKGYALVYNFHDESDEQKKNGDIVSKIRAALQELGKSVPGVDEIIEKLETGKCHWSDGSIGTLISISDYDTNRDTFEQFSQIARKYGLRAKATSLLKVAVVNIGW